jgi:phage-related holin
MEHYYFLIKLFDFSTDKAKDASIFSISASSIISILLSIFNGLEYFCKNMLGISVALLLAIFTIMIIDYITGLKAAKKEEKDNAKKENREIKNILSSKKGLNWVFKFGSYVGFIWLMNIIIIQIQDKNLDLLGYPIALIQVYIIIHIMYWEVVSIDENLERIGLNFKILKLFKDIIEKLKLSYKKKIDE